MGGWTRNQLCWPIPACGCRYQPELGELSAPRAAPALVHKLTIVTRNIRDVSVANLAVFNPWQALA